MSLRIGLKAVLVYQDKVLLLKRVESISRAGKWDLPGGIIDSDEKLLKGLQREVFEETGIKIRKVNVTLDVGYFNEGIYKLKNVIRIIYLSRIDTNEVVLSSEHSEFKWLDLKELVRIESEDFISPKIYKKLQQRLKEVLNSKMESFKEEIL